MNCPACDAVVSSSNGFCPRCGRLLGARSDGSAAPAGKSLADTAALPVTAPITPGTDPSATARIDPTAAAAAMPSAPRPVPAGGSEPAARPARAAGTASVTGRASATGTVSPSELSGSVASDTATTAPVPPVTARASGTDLADRLRIAADRLGRAAPEVRLALAGAAVVLFGFLALPYALALGAGVEVGGRVWWRPITAVVATALLVAALRVPAADDRDRVASYRADARGVDEGLVDPYPAGQYPGGSVAPARPRTKDYRLIVVAVVLATVGATEAGLLGLVSGDNPRLRAGYYVMLLGSVLVAAASITAALRRTPLGRV